MRSATRARAAGGSPLSIPRVPRGIFSARAVGPCLLPPGEVAAEFREPAAVANETGADRPSQAS